MKTLTKITWKTFYSKIKSFKTQVTIDKNSNFIEKKNVIFKTPNTFKSSRARKYNDEDDNNLPKYVSILRSKGEKIGYNIAIPSIIKPNGKRYTRKFANKRLTMEKKLSLCIETLDKIKKEHDIKD